MWSAGIWFRTLCPLLSIYPRRMEERLLRGNGDCSPFLWRTPDKMTKEGNSTTLQISIISNYHIMAPLGFRDLALEFLLKVQWGKTNLMPKRLNNAAEVLRWSLDWSYRENKSATLATLKRGTGHVLLLPLSEHSMSTFSLAKYYSLSLHCAVCGDTFLLSVLNCNCYEHTLWCLIFKVIH